jgi:hypothetical protein
VKYLIFLLLFLTSCPKDKSFDWSSQPHQDIIPRPSGRWDTNPVVSLHMQNISTSVEDAPIWMISDAASIVINTSSDIFVWSNNIGYNIDTGLSGSIDIYLYYTPPSKSSMNAISIAEKFISTTPPSPKTSYTGLTQLNIQGGVIKHATVWLNVNRFEQYYQEYRAKHPQALDADLRLWAVQKATEPFKKIIWHELGHALYGLSDDTQGSTPGAMVYNSMIYPYSENETDVIRWLYNLPGASQ